MPRVFISDTSPIRYLVRIGQADLLPWLHTEVLIPDALGDELNHPATPEPVGRWIVQRPSWLRVVALAKGSPSLPRKGMSGWLRGSRLQRAAAYAPPI